MDMTRDGELATRDYLALVLSAPSRVRHRRDAVADPQAVRALEIYADPAWAPSGFVALADKSLQAMRDAAPGSDHQLAWVHALLGSARTPAHLEVVAGLLDGTAVPEGLAVDDELRWSIVQSMSALGALGAMRSPTS